MSDSPSKTHPVPAPAPASPATDGSIPQCRVDFDRIPWCANFLSAPGITSFQPRQHRTGLPQQDQDQFFGTTLRHPRCVPAYAGFYPEAAAPEPIARCGVLYSLGSGVNGFPGTAHGGIICSLLDEVMAVLVAKNIELGRRGFVRDRGIATKRIDVRFRRPVRAPGVILGVAWLGKVEGKRIDVKAELRDSEGVVLATCDGEWISLRTANL